LLLVLLLLLLLLLFFLCVFYLFLAPPAAQTAVYNNVQAQQACKCNASVCLVALAGSQNLRSHQSQVHDSCCPVHAGQAGA
jgi:hypothetical protein